MRNLYLILLLLPCASMAVPNIADGKLLYEESCAKCHGSDYYQGLSVDEITNTVELSHWVDTCSTHFNLGWNDQDIEDTVHYLNREFFLIDE